MIKHVVMIKLAKINSKEERIEMATEVLNRLDKLPEQIKEIKGYDTGLNIKPCNDPQNYHDIVLVSDFDNPGEMQKYIKHPAHTEVVQFIKELGGEFTSVDYEY